MRTSSGALPEDHGQITASYFSQSNIIPNTTLLKSNENNSAQLQPNPGNNTTQFLNAVATSTASSWQKKNLLQSQDQYLSPQHDSRQRADSQQLAATNLAVSSIPQKMVSNSPPGPSKDLLDSKKLHPFHHSQAQNSL